MPWMRRNVPPIDRASALASRVLPDARDVLDEHVSARQDRRDGEPERLGLAPDDTREVRVHAGGELGGVVQRVSGGADLGRRHRS